MSGYHTEMPNKGKYDPASRLTRTPRAEYDPELAQATIAKFEEVERHSGSGGRI